MVLAFKLPYIQGSATETLEHALQTTDANKVGTPARLLNRGVMLQNNMFTVGSTCIWRDTVRVIMIFLLFTHASKKVLKIV